MVDLRIQLPEHFLEEEIRDGYRVSAAMKQAWAVELDLLAEFMRVCDKYDIKWYPDGGTMLGAVRHKGFIPWDNDIDIALPRKDYEKLCFIAKDEFRDPYFFQTAITDINYPRLHAQLRNSKTTGILLREWSVYNFNQGIFIDLFPFDNIPDSDSKVQTFGRRIIDLAERMSFHLEYTVYYRPSQHSSRVKRLKHSIKHMLAVGLFDYDGRPKELFDRTNELLSSYKEENTQRFANLSLPQFTMSRQNFFRKEWFDEIIMMPFEFFELPVPKGYEEYLRMLYGDWQKYVVSGSLHGDTFFDVDKPYSFYISPDNQSCD